MPHKVNRMVLDLSHHNKVIDYDEVAKAGIAGIIHKASESTGFVDSQYGAQRHVFEARGFEWGAYHFGTNTNVSQQVDNFLQSANPANDTLLCLDWEPYGARTMTVEQAVQWIQMVESKLNRQGDVVLYSGNLAKEQLGKTKNTFLGARRLWLAQYGTNPVPQASWDDFWLWQYSDGKVGPEPHGCPGVLGAVDTNSFDGTTVQLRAEWAGGKPSKPVVQEQIVRVIAPAGVTVVVEKGEV